MQEQPPPLTLTDVYSEEDRIQFISNLPKRIKSVARAYFTDIFKDLLARSDNPQKGIDMRLLQEMFDFPGIIGERFFSVLDEDNNGYLDESEFVNGLLRLYNNDFAEKLKFIFQMYDFKKRLLISKDEIMLVLSHVPITKIKNESLSLCENDSCKFSRSGIQYIKFTDRLESIKQLESLIELCMKDKEAINFAQFKEICEKHSCEMFLCLYFLLEMKMPNADQFKFYNNAQKPVKARSINIASLSKFPVMASPKVLTKFTPILPMIQQTKSGTNIKPNNQKRRSSLIPIHNPAKMADFTEALSKIVDDNAPNLETKTNITITDEENKHMNVKRLANRAEKNELKTPEKTNPKKNEHLETPSTFLSVKGGYKSPRSTFFNLQNSNQVHLGEESIVTEKEIECEGYLYYYTAPTILKRFWCKLYNQELYWYVKKEDEKHFDMINLRGKYLEKQMKDMVGGILVFPFEIFSSPRDKKLYYAINETDLIKWTTSIKKSIGYCDFHTYYELNEVLGQGKFGTVHLSRHLKTGKKVAVKVIKLKGISAQDNELIKREIEIMKLCQHPNIIRLLDLFQSPKKIYIVLEFMKGGDMFNYLKKNDFKLPEEKAKKIIHSLASAVFYLHSYGIVHRDLKPENILLTSSGNDCEVKIADFGLSKIIGPEDKCDEPFGTITYVAPEIVHSLPYTKAVDIWSLGVITYLILTGRLPFNGKTKEEIAKKIVTVDPNYSFQAFKNVSVNAQSLIISKNSLNNLLLDMLRKNPKKRISIIALLEHSWLNQKLQLPTIKKEPRRNSYFLTVNLQPIQ